MGSGGGLFLKHEAEKKVRFKSAWSLSDLVTHACNVIPLETEQEDQKLEVSLGYIARLFLRETDKQTKGTS